MHQMVQSRGGGTNTAGQHDLQQGLQGLLQTHVWPACSMQGYKQVCGFADVWGDGIIPLESAHLDGAQGDLN